MPKKFKAKIPPHLVPDGTSHRCSVCGYPFGKDVFPSLEAAFAEHLKNSHQPGQTSEDANQAAARMVKETTERD